MKIKFNCPTCGAKYQADSESVGKKGKCKRCGSSMEVPAVTQDNHHMVDSPKPSGEPKQNNETKPCPACGETIKASALKCRFCGEDLRVFQAKREAEVEKNIFIGNPAVIYSIGQWFWIVITLGLAALIYWIRSISTKYQITTQRIKVVKGIFSKATNNIELYRIDDFDVYHPFTMRILGYGVLELKSSDRNAHDFYIYGLKNVDNLYEELRSNALNERERRGIKVWANA